MKKPIKTYTHFMERITVTIPAQKYSVAKYIGDPRCYLEEALDLVLPDQDISVSSCGYTRINGVKYKTEGEFNSGTVEKAFNKGEDIKVTLIRQKQ